MSSIAVGGRALVACSRHRAAADHRHRSFFPRCSSSSPVFVRSSSLSALFHKHDNVGWSSSLSSSLSLEIHQYHSTATAAAASTASSSKPSLKHIPSFPFVGSFIPRLSGIPDNVTKPYDFWPELRQQYGDFYTMGIPSIGNPDCLYRTTYIVTDPRQMVPVIKAGGAYPSGFVEVLWVSKKWNTTRGIHSKGLLERGPEWKRLRTFMQTDLLHPDAARGYVPGMIQAAQLASRGAAAAAAPSSTATAAALNVYVSRCAFDLFSTIMFGELTQVADPTTPTNAENERFVTHAMDGLSTSIEMLLHPYEHIMGNMLGVTTKKCQFALENVDVAWEIGQRKIAAFMERKQNHALTENEQQSYLCRALDRQQAEDSQVSIREVQELAFTGLLAAVDTTSSVLGWNLFHVARSPSVQERLHEELVTAIQTVGTTTTTTTDSKDSGHHQGRGLTEEALLRNHVPYLYAIIRETQRMTPADPLYVSKQLDEDGVVVNDIPLKKGDVVSLEGFSIGMNPTFVEDPHVFRPERWFPEAVAARKGTHQEIIDHPFLKEPFSQGARKCPGSRVAINEILVMLSQLVLDWKITSPITDLKDATYKQGSVLEVELPQLVFESRA